MREIRNQLGKFILKQFKNRYNDPEDTIMSYKGLKTFDIFTTKIKAVNTAATFVENARVDDTNAVSLQTNITPIILKELSKNKEFLNIKNGILTEKQNNVLISMIINQGFNKNLINKTLEVFMREYNIDKQNKEVLEQYLSNENIDIIENQFLETFEKEPNNFILLIKPNKSIKKELKAIVSENNEIPELTESINNIDDEYNMDTLVFAGNTVFADETKAGIDSATTKFYANLKNIKSEMDFLTVIAISSDTIKQIIEDVSDEDFKASFEYQNFSKVLKNPNYKLNDKEEAELRLQFYTRLIRNAIDINTFPEIITHLLISRTHLESLKLNNEQDIINKYQIRFPNISSYLSILNENVEIDENIKKMINKKDEEVNILSKYIPIYGKNEEYSIQVNSKLGQVFLKNEVKYINLKLMERDILESPLLTNDIKMELENIKNKSNIVSKANIILSLKDMLSQYNLLSKSYDVNKPMENKIQSLIDNLNKSDKENYNFREIEIIINKALSEIQPGLGTDNTNFRKNLVEKMNLNILETPNYFKELREISKSLNINQDLSKKNNEMSAAKLAATLENRANDTSNKIAYQIATNIKQLRTIFPDPSKVLLLIEPLMRGRLFIDGELAPEILNKKLHIPMNEAKLISKLQNLIEKFDISTNDKKDILQTLIIETQHREPNKFKEEYFEVFINNVDFDKLSLEEIEDIVIQIPRNNINIDKLDKILENNLLDLKKDQIIELG